jgi:decaprenyl-diphosphate synthase subunit 2
MNDPENEWTLRHILSAGSLLGKSCQGALKLAGLSDDFQKKGYSFGKHLALAWQACIDIEPFRISTIPYGAQFSLVSAPVLYHLDQDPDLYQEIAKGKSSIENIDYHKIHEIICKGPGVEKTKELQQKHSLAALKVLSELQVSDARTALQNIILAMQDL